MHWREEVHYRPWKLCAAFWVSPPFHLTTWSLTNRTHSVMPSSILCIIMDALSKKFLILQQEFLEGKDHVLVIYYWKLVTPKLSRLKQKTFIISQFLRVSSPGGLGGCLWLRVSPKATTKVSARMESSKGPPWDSKASSPTWLWAEFRSSLHVGQRHQSFHTWTYSWDS